MWKSLQMLLYLVIKFRNCAQFWIFDIQFMKWIGPIHDMSVSLGKGHNSGTYQSMSPRHVASPVTNFEGRDSAISGYRWWFLDPMFFVLPKTDTIKKKNMSTNWRLATSGRVFFKKISSTWLRSQKLIKPIKLGVQFNVQKPRGFNDKYQSLGIIIAHILLKINHVETC